VSERDPDHLIDDESDKEVTIEFTGPFTVQTNKQTRLLEQQQIWPPQQLGMGALTIQRLSIL